MLASVKFVFFSLPLTPIHQLWLPMAEKSNCQCFLVLEVYSGGKEIVLLLPVI